MNQTAADTYNQIAPFLLVEQGKLTDLNESGSYKICTITSFFGFTGRAWSSRNNSVNELDEYQ